MNATIPPGKGLDTPVQYIKGIGPRRAAALTERGLRTVRDMLFYFPYDYLDVSKVEAVGNLHRHIDSGEWITVIGTVRTFDLIGRPPRHRFVVILEDETGTVPLVFFQSVNFFKKAFTPGEVIAVSGRITEFKRRPQIIHPSIDRLATDGNEEGDLKGFLHTGGLVPKYGSSQGLKEVNLHLKGLRRVMKSIVDDYAGAVEEHLPEEIRDRYDFPDLPDALRMVHFPSERTALDRSRRRLKFDELFSMQLLLALQRRKIKSDRPGITFNVESTLARRLVDALPFSLTPAQRRVIREIAEDMKTSRPMNRLLQGDVGSGKTIVALIAMLISVDNGYQAAFMAPTEILAEQHWRTIGNFLKEIPISVRLLVGNQPARLRQDILDEIRRGSAQITIGTHALIQEDVEFARLGLVVIDEQHRFGVSQRVALRLKGGDGGEAPVQPDVLIMTATPIPRTLSLTLYGDLDVSTIDMLPSGRQAVKTIVKPEHQRGSVYGFLREEVRRGRQAYIVYPLVEESEKLDLKAATEGYELLRKDVFPELSIGLVHGRMPAEEKDRIMTRFKEGDVSILVATTVIEVGIDVPNATVMVIEHAERFGLSQLHQLRGRVGRGADQSTCILLAPGWMAKLSRTGGAGHLPGVNDEDAAKAERRLRTMVETTDGFKIAEIDLELRGPGDFFGTRQSGLPFLQIANLLTDQEILALARREAFALVDTDPHLRLSGHASLRRYVRSMMESALLLAETG